MSQATTVTFDLLCGNCNRHTSITQPIHIGDNTADFACVSCGERWHVFVEITSLDPFHVGTMLTKRVLGILKNGHFFPKEQLS